MSCPSYPPFNPMMYRNQTTVPQYPNGSVHSWYAANYPQNSNLMSSVGHYGMQDEQQFWHHQNQPYGHTVFHNMMPQHPHQHHHQNDFKNESFENNQLPSPTTTVTSNLSSPNCVQNDSSNPGMCLEDIKPVIKRAPFEWIKKTPPRRNEQGKTRTKDKYRVVYTDHQRIELEKEFYYNRYINMRRKSELSLALGLTDRQIKIWFQNRRAKERKQVKKREELSQHSPGVPALTDCARYV